jgi:hypothetical protein
MVRYAIPTMERDTAISNFSNTLGTATWHVVLAIRIAALSPQEFQHPGRYLAAALANWLPFANQKIGSQTISSLH